MRKNQKVKYNPTVYFFQQAQQVSNEPRPEVQKLVGQLIDMDCCMLCKERYDLSQHLPRIMVHCGHTFCQSCLSKFHKNQRVRCPVCLKLIRNIERLERLPINHTIFAKMIEEINRKSPEDEKINIQEALVNQFIQAQNMKQTAQQPEDTFNILPPQIINQVLQQAQRTDKVDIAKIDPEVRRLLKSKNQDEQLGMCEHHKDRIKHFYCMVHKTSTCRVCTQIIHGSNECVIIDFYDIEDMGIRNFLNQVIFINPYLQQDQNNNNSDQDLSDSHQAHS